MSKAGPQTSVRQKRGVETSKAVGVELDRDSSRLFLWSEQGPDDLVQIGFIYKLFCIVGVWIEGIFCPI